MQPTSTPAVLLSSHIAQPNCSSTSADQNSIPMTKALPKMPPCSKFESQLEQILHSQQEPHLDDLSELWPRPVLPAGWDCNANDLVFQQIEIDESSQPRPRDLQLPHFNHLGPSTQLPTLRFYGVTQQGHSVICHVHGFFPYFYIPAPHGFNPSIVPDMITHLNKIMHQDKRNNSQSASNVYVLDIDILEKESIIQFHGNRKLPYLKITLLNPKHASQLRSMFERGMVNLNQHSRIVFSSQTYESNIAYLMRYMIDAEISGMSWITLPRGTYNVRPKAMTSGPASSSSYVQLEVDIVYSDVKAHESVGEWSMMAPLRILSFDIECSGRKGHFPDPKFDQVIQIANMVTLQGHPQPFIRNVFTLNTCAPIVGSDVKSYTTEAAMLEAWSQFIRIADPDVIIGYNILNFDFPYLIDRADKLKIPQFPYFGRIDQNKVTVKDSRFQSKAFGLRESKQINLDGRIVMDVFQLISRDYKLRSYSLNAVSAHFLGEQKEDVHYSIITELQNGNAETRRRLAVYCLKDAYLPQRLMDKLMLMINYSEMARVTGVPFNFLLTRGQQIKVVSQLYRKTRDHDLVIPAYSTTGPSGGDDDGVGFEGATVIEPERGYYDVPIATLDFASLYPSIMMAHNLCYTTLLTNEVISHLNLVEGTDYTVTPTGDKFVKAHIRKGLLAVILEDLLQARKRAKSDLKLETDPFKRAVLDGRQLALKISANSVYGFTGATVGKLPCLQISASVTAFGREMIELTKLAVEREFTVQNGYAGNAHVIYGDTDSVMVRFGVQELDKVMALGKQAASYVSNQFVKPIQLEFEKVYYPYLLINKKRYAGLYWTNPHTYDKMDTKGLETVRRDNAPLVAHVIDTCLRRILMERDVPGAIEFVKATISDLLQNRVDLSQLVISKQLSKSDYAAKQAHVELAERMRKRDPGSAPNIGDRVAYVIVQGAKGAAAYEKAEDPLYVLDNNIPIDTKYYLENQLSKPLIRIFEPILGDSTEAKLLKGDHTRSVTVTSHARGALAKFTVKTVSCLGCRTPLKGDAGKKAVCIHCQPKLPSLNFKQVVAANKAEERFARLWTQCQNCQGSLHLDVLCSANDCPIFYMRKKAQKDAKDATDALARFDYDW